MLKETAKDLKEDDKKMIISNDPSDPITGLFSYLIWGPYINQGQDVQADWECLQYAAPSLIFL